jgi:hypothetical protein
MVQPPEQGPWRRIRAAVDGYASSIVRLIGESYGRDAIQRAWQEFRLRDDTTFSVDDPHAELFFSWLFHRWAPREKKGVPPTRAYLDSHAACLDSLLRRYLEACLVTRFGFYQILECRPGAGFDARDLLASREIEVNEALASVSLTSGDIIFAYLPSVDGIVLVDAISPFSFPSTFAASVRGDSSRRPTDRSLRKLYFALLNSYLLYR